MTKVKDLLRESQENAFNSLKANEDIVEIFNLKMKSEDGLDDTSKKYYKRLMKLRKDQQEFLPLFLEMKKKIARHKKCLKIVLQEHE